MTNVPLFSSVVCDECHRRHPTVFVSGAFMDDPNVFDRIHHPWKYPDAPQRYVFDPFPEWTAVQNFIDEARWRIRRAWTILIAGDDDDDY